MRGFIAGDSIGLGWRRAHAELDRAFDQGEGLALAVHIPAPRAAGLEIELGQAGIRVRELRLLAPLSQCPFGCAVDAGVGVVFVEIEQFGDQGLAVSGGEFVGGVGA